MTSIWRHLSFLQTIVHNSNSIEPTNFVLGTNTQQHNIHLMIKMKVTLTDDGWFAPMGFVLCTRILGRFAPSGFVLCTHILGRFTPSGFMLRTSILGRFAPPDFLLRKDKCVLIALLPWISRLYLARFVRMFFALFSQKFVCIIFFSKTNTWCIISFCMSIRSN